MDCLAGSAGEVSRAGADSSMHACRDPIHRRPGRAAAGM